MCIDKVIGIYVIVQIILNCFKPFLNMTHKDATNPQCVDYFLRQELYLLRRQTEDRGERKPTDIANYFVCNQILEAYTY